MSVPRQCESAPKQGVSVMCTSTAAREAFDLLNAGTKQEYRGWGDTLTAARDRAAKNAGVTPAQAERIWKHWRSMRNPNGDVYRGLRNTYGHLCSWIETAADNMERRRLERARNAAFESTAEAGEGNHPRRRAGDKEGLK